MGYGARRNIGVDRELFAGHAVERKSRADFRHSAGAFRDNQEINDQKNSKNDKPKKHVAADDEHRKSLDDAAGGVRACVSLVQ